MNMQVLDARCDVGGGYKVDTSRGERIGRVSSEWFSRPDDERYLSLGDLARSVRGRSERSRTRVVESALIHVEASRNDPERKGDQQREDGRPDHQLERSRQFLHEKIESRAFVLERIPKIAVNQILDPIEVLHRDWFG